MNDDATTARIRQLRAQAASAGDHAQVLVCDIALGDVEPGDLERLHVWTFVRPESTRQRIREMDQDAAIDACAEAIA